MRDAGRYAACQIQGEGHGHQPFIVGNPAIFESCLLCYLQWELGTDH